MKANDSSGGRRQTRLAGGHLLGVVGDALVRDGFTQPLVDAIFLSIFTVPVLVAVALMVTEAEASGTDP